jgi:hypothetical protein
MMLCLKVQNVRSQDEDENSLHVNLHESNQTSCVFTNDN